jgi:Zn-dependent M28 family amino/carboxypeptidase
MRLLRSLLFLPLLLLVSLLACEHSPSSASANTSTGAQEQHPQTAPAPQINLPAEPAGPALHINADRAMQYVKDIVTIGPRWVGSKGQQKMAAYLRAKLKNDNLEEDAFEADTPAGKMPMRNFIAKFHGSKDGIIVLGSHIDTNYPLRNTTFAGANDGGSSTALLLAIADQLRGKKLEGYSVWLAFLDGEEAIQKWSASDSIYGSRHLAAKWQQDGTLPKIRAFLLADMIGDADLNIERDGNSTPWLEDLVLKAATRLGYQSHFFGRDVGGIEDDHLPFARLGVPVADIIDMDYGYNDSYHHTVQDTIDKLSTRSLQISGDVILEAIRLLNANAGNLPAPAGGPAPRVPS